MHAIFVVAINIYYDFMQCIDLAFSSNQKQHNAISVDCINYIIQNFSYTSILIILLSSKAIYIVMYALVSVPLFTGIMCVISTTLLRL